MGKRKQPDFQKTKLRVGRLLPKGKNVTNTAFKSKKIILPSQKIEKSDSASENLKDLLLHVSHHNPTWRADNLNKVRMHIQENNAFVANLPDILEKVLKSILDEDSSVRNAAIKVLKMALNSISDSQVECFMQPLKISLRCAMTHCDVKVHKNALDFLDVLLETHPKLLSRFHDLLNAILDLISTKSISKNPMNRKKRSLPPLYADHLNSQKWRIEILKRLESFLKAILGNIETKEMEPEDEQVVYWNAQEALYLPLYAGGGLKPLEWEMLKDSLGCSAYVNVSWTSDELKNYVDELIPILMDIFAEEILEFSAELGDCSLPPSTIENLGTIVQIFCCLGDWIKSMSKQDKQLELWFSNKFSDVCYKLMKGFPYSNRLKNPQVQHGDSLILAVRLNLALCYFYCGFVAESSFSKELQTAVQKYLHKIFTMKYAVRHDSIPTLLKIARCWLSVQHIRINMDAFLMGLCGIIRDSEIRVNRSALETFFIEILLDPKYNDFSNISAVYTFFVVLLKELNEMRKSNAIDRQLLKNIRKICALGNKGFYKSLNQNFKQKEFIEMLEFEDEDFQETVVYMLCKYKPFDLTYLANIADIILTPSFSPKAASQLIRLLAQRFSQDESHEYKNIRLVYIKFLLNVASDSSAISDEKWENFDDEFNFRENWAVVDDISPYRIYPSMHWKMHSKVFQVCKDSLKLFPEKEVWESIYKFILEILKHASTFPVHCVIALWRIKMECDTSIVQNTRQFDASLNSLLFSSLLYSSVLSQHCKNDEYFKYGINELTESVDLSSKTPDLLKEMEIEAQKIKDIDAVQYLLRIIYYLLSKRYVNANNQRKILPLLRYLQEAFGEELRVRPFWNYICECYQAFH